MRGIIIPFLLLLTFSSSLNAQVVSAEPLPYLPFSKWTDFNNDGSPDLISRQNDYLKVFKVNGFSTTLHDEVSNTHGSFSPVDIDGDGFPEIMVNNVNYLYYYPNDQGDLKPGKIHIYNVPLSGPDIAGHFAQDMDNDGDPDVIIVMDDSRYYFMENVNGEIKSDEKIEIANLNVGGGATILFCDYNQDGYMDMIVNQVYKGVHLFLNTGYKQYSVKRLLTQENQVDMAITDFDLDGFPDIIVAIATYNSSGTYGSVIIRMNEASVGLPYYSLPNLYYPLSVKPINLDADPDIEILVGDDQSLMMADLQNGTLTREVLWGTPGNVFYPPSTDIEVGDYDHDGKLDVLHMVFNSESSLLKTDFNTPLEPLYSCSQFIDTLLCPSGNVHLSDQGQVNEFANNFPYCKYLNGSLHVTGNISEPGILQEIISVRGSVVIENTQIENIFWSGLKHVRGNVTIADNPELNFVDLENIQFIHGNLEIHDNSALTEINLPNTLEILSNLEVANNPLLKSIHGPEDLRDVSWSKFIDNPLLDSLNGFQEINGNLLLDNSPIKAMQGFSNSDTIVIKDVDYTDLKVFKWIRPTYIRLDNVRQLTQFTHLTQPGPGDRFSLSVMNCPDLVRIGLALKINHIELINNPVLEDITSLDWENTFSTDAIIQHNPKLTSLAGLEYVSGMGGKILIDHNAMLNNIGSLTVGNSAPIDTLSITFNPALSLCNTELVCDLLWGSVPHTITGNDEGCMNAPEVQAACGLFTSEETVVDKDEIFIYPNPASDELHVDGRTIPNQLIIFSTNGKEILRVSNADKVILPDLSPGIYFVRVILNDKTICHTFTIAK